ncbi:MAG: ROK family protein [bacterium]
MLALGIDLGGTHIKVALVESSGNIKKDMQLDTRVKEGPAAIIQDIKKACKQLIAKKGNQRIKGIGVGIAGDIDQRSGKVRFSPNLNWKNVWVGRELKKYFNIPVIIENDANAAAWGAYILDSKKKIKNIITLTLGTGVGGGIIFDGKLFRGSTGSAGEIGHIPLYPYGPKCSCGCRGCLECYVGAPHLVRKTQEAIMAGRKTLISDMVHDDLNAITSIIIEIAAKKGDGLAREIWDTAGKSLGIAIGGLINLLNPRMIVLAGGTSRAGKLILDPMWYAIKKHSFSSVRKNLSIIVSRHDKDLGVVGAALLVWDS